MTADEIEYGRELLARVKRSQLVCTKTADGYLVDSDDTVLLAWVRQHLGGMLDGQQALEERVAFAEQASDNAIKQRDDALERSKAKAQSAGDRISALVSTIRTIMSWRCWPATRSEAVEKRIAEILAKEDA